MRRMGPMRDAYCRLTLTAHGPPIAACWLSRCRLASLQRVRGAGKEDPVTASAAIDVMHRSDIAAEDRRIRFETEAVPFMRQMFPAAVRLTRDRCDAEDLIQDTFARAYLKFHQFTPGTNLRAWLHRIMFHTFYSSCRKKRSKPAETLAGNLYEGVDSHAGLALSARSAEAEALENLAGSAIMRSLAELPQCFKTAIYLADIEGYRYSEIASILDVPIGTVMSRIHRGRNLLRRKLAGCGRTADSADAQVHDLPAAARGPARQMPPLRPDPSAIEVAAWLASDTESAA